MIGGGIIGLEMACVYDALGSRVSVVELTTQLMPGCDPDLVRPLERRIRSRYEQILLGTRVAQVEALAEGIRVTFEGEKAPAPQVFGRVLVAVGRSPNGKLHRCGGRGCQRIRSRLHPGRQATAHQRTAYLRGRRYRRSAHVGAQGDA